MGKTPFEIVSKLKTLQKYNSSKISYAGRLDPMAEGLILMLINEENKNRKKYEKLKKTYEFEVLFGATTDSYDILGIPKLTETTKFDLKKAKKYLDKLEGSQVQKYPPFSYPKIKGKPLFKWAREGRIDEINLPEKKIEIYKTNYKYVYQLSAEKLLKYINTNIILVKGDFRQELITSKWQKLLNKKGIKFNIIKCEIECSAGTYVRSIAYEMGRHQGIGSLALSIKRTKIGNFNIDDAISVW